MYQVGSLTFCMFWTAVKAGGCGLQKFWRVQLDSNQRTLRIQNLIKSGDYE